MNKPELTAERIEAVREYADDDYNAGYGPHLRERAQTTLALIESRKQALELLRLAVEEDQHWALGSNRTAMGYGGITPATATLIAAFLQQNQ